MAADAMTALGLFVAVSLLRFGPDWTEVWRRAGLDPFAAMSTYAAAWIVALWLFGLYRLRARWSRRAEIADVGRAMLLLAVGAFSILFAIKLPQVSRLFLVALFATQIVVTVGSRFAVRQVLQALRDRGYNSRYILVVGTGTTARAFANAIEGHRELGLRVLGHLGDESDVATVGDRPVLGTIEDIESILHDRIVDEVAICLPAESVGLVEPITRLCEEEGKVVRIPLVEYVVTLPGGRVEEFDGVQVLSLVYGPDRVLGLIAKRVLDFGLGAVALAVAAPVLLAVAVWIRAVDGGPVLFRQTRVGLHGRPFRVVKFRTMVPDAEARLAELEAMNEIKGHAFKLTRDPRLSRTGRTLRATSLDELPQLWNVLKGEMSLVGPRPPLPREVAGYDLWHRRRLSMKPGITGLWQVQARGEEEFDRWVELDLSYIDRWSIWLDLKIMLRTIPAMLQGR
ncbi:MAG TPA: sugar transferase [Vitreimonas sp.]|nr:sugar transferase [Vitreimonas sp.]